MFKFFKKKHREEEFKLMFDIEVLDIAAKKAISDYQETGFSAAKICGASEEEARHLVDLDVMRLKTFMINVKRNLIEGGDLR